MAGSATATVAEKCRSKFHKTMDALSNCQQQITDIVRR
jgi:hypothetical protein